MSGCERPYLLGSMVRIRPPALQTFDYLLTFVHNCLVLLFLVLFFFCCSFFEAELNVVNIVNIELLRW